MLPNAILQALGPLAGVHLTRGPLHAAMPMLLVFPPVSGVHIAIAVVHAAGPVLQVVLPCTCSRLPMALVNGEKLMLSAKSLSPDQDTER